MSRQISRLCAAAAMCMCSLVVSAAAMQQSTTTTEVKKFEVLSVDGNKVVVRGQDGVKEYTVPEDFRFDVDGKQVSVHELKPGMKGSATITTTTIVKPVYATEIRDGEVMRVTGNSIIVRGPKGMQMFTEGDVAKRGVKIMKDGKPVPFSELHAGDHLTATIITEKPPQVMTERQVQASLGAVPPSGTPEAPQGTTGTAGAGASAAAAPSRLPKTASPLPLVGIAGAALLGIGGVLTAIRRRPPSR